MADWSGTEWVNEDGTPFDIVDSLTRNLDFFSDDGGKFGGATDFYVNNSSASDVKYGPLYLRCDEGNPGDLFDCIELCSMTATEMRNGGYEGTVIDGMDGCVYDNLSVRYYPMAGICLGQIDSVIQNCEIAWSGGCVQFVANGKVIGLMGDAINGCGTENCSIIGNYIHDVDASSLIVETYSDVKLKNISVSGNLIERTLNGININDNYNVSFDNVSFNDNVFYLIGATATGMRNTRSELMAGGDWTACFRFREPYDYTNCTISGNEMYYPLYFFYYCDVPMPEMSNNLYVPAKYTLGFADIRYDNEIGPLVLSSIMRKLVQRQDKKSVVRQ